MADGAELVARGGDLMPQKVSPGRPVMAEGVKVEALRRFNAYTDSNIQYSTFHMAMATHNISFNLAEEQSREHSVHFLGNHSREHSVHIPENNQYTFQGTISSHSRDIQGKHIPASPAAQR
jgi:hypothetical protein